MCNPLLKHKGKLEMTPIFFLVGMLAMSLVLTANAQVEVKQSVTTNYNGQKTSIKTDSKAPANICLGLPSACDLPSGAICQGSRDFCTSGFYAPAEETKLRVIQGGGTVDITNKPGEFSILYCDDNLVCHTYKLVKNIIQKVSKK